MHKDEKKDKKEQIKTTGHKWDGIGEYDIPAPRWWLIVWIVSIIWSIGYWFFYPTWPVKGGNTKGSLGWTQQNQLAESQQEIDLKRADLLEKVKNSSFPQIQKDPQLMEFALNGGRVAFKENCSACHGTGAEGAKGYPNLNDDDWLWGGKIEDIYQTLRFGIRSTHDKTRFSQMPAFGLDKVLKKDEIEAVAEHVLSLSGKSSPNPKGAAIFEANCATCHKKDGKGDRTQGAPNLSDAIWLYGDKKEDIIFAVTYSRGNVMPYWSDRLDDATIKQLTLYVHSLGGGE
jgi:cytochrome c oxidase cbb3-type subunit 3